MDRGELMALWDRLGAAQSKQPHFLRRIRVDGIRGVRELSVELRFPVCALAGPNGCGKSTVLLAAACAYNVPGGKSGEVTPARFFSGYSPKKGSIRDQLRNANIQYDFTTPDGNLQMQWRHGQKDWARNFAGKAGAKRPVRPFYYWEFRNLNNLSEMRDILQIERSSHPPKQFPLNSAQQVMASAMFPNVQYREVVRLVASGRNMLFAHRQSGPNYSEPGMASGERVALRFGAELGRLKRNTLVLVDEIETGLHPAVQRSLMGALLQQALRNDLQVLVTTHSPVILDCLPARARIFLHRDDDGKVQVERPYRQDFQNVIYGRGVDGLTVLCEDDMAGGVINGVLDYLVPVKYWPRDAMRVASDVPAKNLVAHAQQLQQLGVVDNYVFALNGSRRNTELAERLRAFGRPILFLPGQSPEEWAWEQMSSAASRYAGKLGFKGDSFNRAMNEAISPRSGITGSEGEELTRARLEFVAKQVQLAAADICRVIAAVNAEREAFEIRLLLDDINKAYRAWTRQDGPPVAKSTTVPEKRRHQPQGAAKGPRHAAGKHGGKPKS